MSERFFGNKPFLPLLLSYFISAVNENFIRIVFLFFVTYQMTQTSPAFFVSAVILYFLFFCIGAVCSGQIADKISKVKFLVFVRLFEVMIMAMALLSIFMDSRLLLTLIAAAMGFANACLRVVNYSVMPQLVDRNHLNTGNIWMKVTTFFSAGCAALLLTSILKFNAAYQVICLIGLILAVVSLFVTLKLPLTDPVDPDSRISKNPIAVFDFVARQIKNRFDLWTYLVGIAWFWILGTLVFVFSAEYGHSVLNARWSTVMFLSTGVFTFGFIGGGYLYRKLSATGNFSGHICLTTLAISVFLCDLVFAGFSIETIQAPKAVSVIRMFSEFEYIRVLIDVAALGILAGLYIIPFYTLLQLGTPERILGRVMSFSGMVNALSVAGAFLVVLSFKILSFSVLDILLCFGIVNIFVGIYMVRLLPIQTRRRVFRVVFKLLFHARIKGLENLKKAGDKALIITNHTSYLDVLLISTFIDRPIVFAVSDQLIDKTVVKFMTNLVDVRPLDPMSPFAVKAMVEELKKNQLCMIFTEGIIEGGNTRMKIYEGPAMMALKAEAPIVPIRIDGADQTFFSRVLKTKAPFRFFPTITLTVKKPVFFDLPDDLTTRECREKSSSMLFDVLSDMTFENYRINRTVFGALADSMQMVGRFKRVLEDTDRKPLSFWAVFMRSFILGRLLKRALSDEKEVGLMVPTSNTCALCFLGLHAFGKTPAMINFTSGPKQVIATCRTVGLKTIVTAKKVVLLAKLEGLVSAVEEAGIRVLYLEDLKPTLSFTDKMIGIIGGMFPKLLYRKVEATQTPEDPAVILFTSGSEGFPKAVFLTHRNLLANCYQIPSRFDVYPTDVFLNCLPMFHSFGLGAGTILPLLLGVKTVLYPTPLHYRIIPEICASAKATIFFGTDTFLAGYAKCANPYDFNSLRIVAAGAEKVKDETRKIWAEKFGVRLFEGYGATECSPFISVNTFLHQKKGSVGRLLPHIEYRLKPVEGIKEGKELWIKGPNIMKGYMRYDKPLVLDPPADGWYDTGDIVDIDAEGYIFIKGRCKRFAKIGGEMVSLLAVEQVIDKRWPGFVFGAVSIPDARKGEQIVLITTCPDVNREEMIVAFKAAGVTELGLPSKVIVTNTPPLLGTGKFDYVLAKELAQKGVA